MNDKSTIKRPPDSPQSTPKSPAAHTPAEPSRAEVDALLAFFGQKRYAEAESLARAMTMRFPSHGFGWKALGAILKQQGRRAEALSALAKAVQRLPQDPETHYNLGNALLDQGRLAEAESSYRNSLALRPDYFAAHYNLGNVLQTQTKYIEAEESYLSALRLNPDFADAHSNFGIVLREQGRIAEAETSFRRLLALRPQDAQAHNNLANILHESGRSAEAEVEYCFALQIQPNFAEARYNLGNLLKEQGGLVEAEAAYRKVIDSKPRFAAAHFNLGYVLNAQKRPLEAERAYRQALEIDPEFAEGYCHLGVLLREQDLVAEAEACYRRALQADPDYADAHNNLGNALREQGRLDEAAACYRRALELQPEFAEANYNLANVFKDQGYYGEAETNYRRALELLPDYAKAHSNLANALKEQGRLEEAIQSYETAISLKPDFIESHYGLSSLKTYTESDPHLAVLEQQLPRVEGLPVEAQVRYWFTLGKVREDMGRYDESFAAYREGNRLQHAALPLDETAEDALLEQMLTVFSKKFFSARLQPAPAGKAPIFIVGMPRSGTSLLEQILASCPGVFGAGELPDLGNIVAAAMPGGAHNRFPAAVADLSCEDFRHMGRQYTETIWKHAPDAARITDKMPANFLYLGMIHLMLPNAKIIHAMRDPMDSCFSCYSRLFNDGNLSFAYDLESLGRYYARYIKLMRHWQEVLPAGTILNMPYEDMVADTEAQTRRLLAYLGLPWDSQCLAFHQNKRRVITASAAQVRKPIYRSSLARWERYRNHLAPLLELVKEYRGCIAF